MSWIDRTNMFKIRFKQCRVFDIYRSNLANFIFLNTVYKVSNGTHIALFIKRSANKINVFIMIWKFLEKCMSSFYFSITTNFFYLNCTKWVKTSQRIPKIRLGFHFTRKKYKKSVIGILILFRTKMVTTK